MSNDTQRIYKPDFNLLAVSLLLQETALNTEQALSHTMMVDQSDLMVLTPKRETNAGELTGMEEPDLVYNLGAESSMNLTFNKAKAQDFLLSYAYGLGIDTPAAWGGGYQHAIRPTPNMNLPSFTAAQRMGKTIWKWLMASMFVDSITATFAKDSWAKCVTAIKGTGKYTANMYEETVTAAYNAASLTLAANGVQGADAPTRLMNVHRIRVVNPSAPNEWDEVAFSAVSGAVPAVITITPPGAVVTSTTYQVLYTPVEPAWCAFPARVDEPPLRVTDLVVTLGGAWSGSAFVGGRTIDSEISTIEHSFKNQVDVEYRPGGTGTYANFAQRQGRQQSLKLDRQAREYILQQAIADNEYFGVHIKATGPTFETGKNYYIELIFPRCNILKAPLKIDNKFLGEEGDIQVLQDSTYGSIMVNIGNKIATAAG